MSERLGIWYYRLYAGFRALIVTLICSAWFSLVFMVVSPELTDPFPPPPPDAPTWIPPVVIWSASLAIGVWVYRRHFK